MTVAVQTHGFAQLLKLKVVEFDDHTLAAQPDCEICRPVIKYAMRSAQGAKEGAERDAAKGRHYMQKLAELP